MTEKAAGTKLHYGDFIVIFGYFAFVLFVGLWVSITCENNINW